MVCLPALSRALAALRSTLSRRIERYNLIMPTPTDDKLLIALKRFIASIDDAHRDLPMLYEPEISAGSGLISAFNEVLDERVKIAVQKELNQRRNH